MLRFEVFISALDSNCELILQLLYKLDLASDLPTSWKFFERKHPNSQSLENSSRLFVMN